MKPSLVAHFYNLSTQDVDAEEQKLQGTLSSAVRLPEMLGKKALSMKDRQEGWAHHTPPWAGAPLGSPWL